MRWVWQQGPREKGSHPFTLDDLWFALGAPEELSVSQLRRSMVGMAARVRRRQRLGMGPWEGVA